MDKVSPDFNKTNKITFTTLTKYNVTDTYKGWNTSTTSTPVRPRVTRTQHLISTKTTLRLTQVKCKNEVKDTCGFCDMTHKECSKATDFILYKLCTKRFRKREEKQEIRVKKNIYKMTTKQAMTGLR